MAIKNFEELKKMASSAEKRTVAVACAHDAHTLEAVLKALGDDIGETDFTAPPEEIRLDGLGINGKGYVVYKALYPEWYFVERYLPT